MDQEKAYKTTCVECNKAMLSTEGFSLDVYLNPWDDSIYTYHYCSEECYEESMSNRDEFYEHCSRCERDIVPNKGYLDHFRMFCGKLVCLACYEKELLENGQPETDFIGSVLRGGMFFNNGNPEPKAAGFEEIVTTGLYNEWGIGRYNERARKLIEQGYDVITCFERIALGGGGTFTLMARKRVSD